MDLWSSSRTAAVLNLRKERGEEGREPSGLSLTVAHSHTRVGTGVWMRAVACVCTSTSDLFKSRHACSSQENKTSLGGTGRYGQESPWPVGSAVDTL
jgi:hypothetical protein